MSHLKKIRFFFVSFLIVILYSCAAPIFIIGTKEQDFLNKCPRARQVESSYERTVYRVGTPGVDGGKYYYFSNNSLFRIDEGVRQPDIRIENTKKN